MPIDQPPTAPNFNALTYSGPTIVITNLHQHGPMVQVLVSGEVQINWKNVEATAADLEADYMTRNYALMLIAARDGTAKPLPDSPP